MFIIHDQIYKSSISDGQNITANNDKFLRLHWEVNCNKIGVEKSKWVFYCKGGSFRKWYGNLEYLVDWSESARVQYKKHSSARIIPNYLWFKEGITWTLITSSKQSFRLLPDCATFDKGGSSIFIKNANYLPVFLMFLNTKISEYVLKLFNSTLNLQVDDVRKLPLSPEKINVTNDIFKALLEYTKLDWDNFETSWDFNNLPILQNELKANSLKETWQKYWDYYQDMTSKMQKLEEENNRIFIDAYGLEDELTPEVPLKEITLTGNPYYRYGINAESDKVGSGEWKVESEEKKDKRGSGKLEEEKLLNSNSSLDTEPFGSLPTEIEKRFLADTMKELLSYAIGCMMGRYSIDKPGLILANQGETVADFISKVGSGKCEVRSAK